MNIYEILQSIPMVYAIGISVIHFLWQGLVVALVLGGILACLKRRSPQVRYLAACIALLAMVALPIITVWHVYPSSPRAVVAGTPVSAATVIQERSGETKDFERDVSVTAVGRTPRAPIEGSPASLSETFLSPRALREQTAALCDKLAPWFALFWLVGVAFQSSYLVGGLYFASILRRRYTSLVGGRWQQTLDRLREALGISRAVALLQSHRISVPATMGWVRPAVLFPVSALTGLTPSQIEALLTHELAHIRRYDYIANLLQNIVETVLFYHPAVWWVSKRIRNERELCCDDIVVEACGDARVYAGALAGMMGLRMQTPAVALAASGGSLSNRIRRLLGVPQRPASHVSRGVSGTIVFAMLLALCATLAAGLIAPLGVETDEEEMLRMALLYREEGERHFDLAEREQAFDAYASAIDVLERLSDEFPDIPDYRFELAKSKRMFHPILSSLDLGQEAEKALLEAIERLESLAYEYPAVLEYRRELTTTYTSIGWRLHNTGRRYGEAADALQRSITTFEQLVADSPGNHADHFELAEALDSLAFFSSNGGAPVRARAMRAAVRHLWRAVELNPTDTSYHKRLAWQSNDLGIELQEWGKIDEAEQVYEQTIAVLEEVVSVAPESRYQLAAVLVRLAILLEETDQGEKAEQVYRQAETVRGELVARFPNLPYEYRASHATRGYEGGIVNPIVDYTVRITSPGEYRLYVRASGHDMASDSFWIWIEELSDGPGGSVGDWYYFIPDAFADFGGKQQQWQNSAYYERMRMSPFHTTRLSAAAWSITTPGDYTIRFVGREDGVAIDAFALRLSSLPALTGYGPEESPVTGDMVFVESEGSVVVEAEHFASRTPRFANWLVVPDEDSGDVPHQNFRGNGYIQLLPDRTPTWEQERDQYVRGIELSPGSANNLAWRLATSPDVGARDPVLAIELAEKAVREAPDDAPNWNTLGVAHYRAGHWEEAITALNKSTELGDCCLGFDFFFVAMAHWQLGNPDQARQWHDKAVEWTDKNRPDNAELARFRAEASELLGISETTGAKEVTPGTNL